VLRVTIDPPPNAWPERMASWRATRNNQRAQRFREQCALPTDRPVVMTGHQPAVWHPGVLAKFIACDSAASTLNAAPAWIVPDQDEVDPFALRIPVADAHDRLRAATRRLAAPSPTGFAACSAPAQHVTPIDASDAPLPSVREGAQRIADALATHANAPSAARQAQGALRDLVAPLAAPAPTIFASDLARTDLFGELLDRMAADPKAVTGAYNDAAGALPQAGVGRLIVNEANDRYELPLWRVPPGEPRRRVYAHELADIPREHLAPRALLMTAIVRLAGCDLFIHGTGGGAYDAVTDRWIDAWLGEPLAPVAVVTATLRLPLRSEIPTPEAAASARWRAHHARHDPALLGDDAAAERKRAAVERIAALRDAGQDPASAFQEMQRDLRDYREANRNHLDELDRAADLAEARLAERDIVADRAWAFPLYPKDALESLRSDIAGAFAQVDASVLNRTPA
jgi:hypothetical protein